MNKVLVTGNAGFIGFHIAYHLLRSGVEVVGFDNVNGYYDPMLKEARLRELQAVSEQSGTAYHFVRADLADKAALDACFADHQFDRVIHLAAQAGVRYSLDAPGEYVSSNLVGFANVLEACRAANTPHLVYASTSSVYGANTKLPFGESDGVDHPLQFYAATKRANELMAHSYSHLFGLPTTGLRFFTVYGPWGRPDMALFLFTQKILAGEPIPVFNKGDHERDFTYIDDIVQGVIKAAGSIAQPDPNWTSAIAAPDPARSSAPFRIYNIGNNSPVRLLTFIEALEEALGKRAIKDLLPLQPGDVKATWADTSSLNEAVGYEAATNVRDGVARFVAWYRAYYGV